MSCETDQLSHEKKQFREFLTAVKGILCTRLRLKATYGFIAIPL